MTNIISRFTKQRLWSVAIGAAFVFGAQAAGDAGVVKVSVASMREAPAHTSALETQALCGTPVELDPADATADWIKARTPDGYEAYIHRTAVEKMTPSRLAAWLDAPKLVVHSLSRQWVVTDTLASAAEPVTDLVNGCIVKGTPGTGRWTSVELPDGRGGFVPSDAVIPYAQWREQTPEAQRVLEVARSLMGTPYLWGGTSTLGVDCSGLTRVAFFDGGMLLPRNASQQALVGEAVECTPESLRPADLVFFAADSAGTRITHVGIYEGDGMIIHASGTVHRSALFTDTLEALPQRMRCARRVIPAAPSTATTTAATPDARFRPTSLIAPVAMVGIGAWGVTNGWLRRVDRHISRELGCHSMHHVDDVLEFVPHLAMVLPDGWLGPSRYSWRERAALTVTGSLITELIVQPVKRLVHSERPDGSDCRSFPSGHTARAFMGAELLRIAYGGWVPYAGYAVAAATGVMRMAAGRHWFTDVVAGAGIGIFSAQMARLLLPLERRLLGGSHRAVALAAYNPALRGPQLSLAITL